jgi:hypothetical protein
MRTPRGCPHCTTNRIGQLNVREAFSSMTGCRRRPRFAVPINMAKKVMDQLIATGHVERGGVVLQDFGRACRRSPRGRSRQGGFGSRPSAGVSARATLS